MTKLYLKIFACFWALCGLILFSGLVYNSTQHRTPLSIINPSSKAVSPAIKLSDDLISSVVGHTLESLCDAMAVSPSRITDHIYLLDENDKDLLERPLPHSIVPMIDLLSNDSRETRLGNNIGRMVTLTDGTELKAITHVADDTNIFFKVYFLNSVPWFITGLGLSALVCFFVARTLAKDLGALKSATRNIAQGDLSIRISPKFRHRNNEFSALAQDFDHMTERLELAMSQQKRLIKDVSHELRSPLARLQVALELAKQRSKGQIDRELEKIGAASEDLEDIITQILAMPVTDQEQFELTDTIDLIGMMSNLADLLAPEAQAKNVQLNLDFACSEVLVQTRGNVLNSIFENILRNAIRYTNNNTEVRITVAPVGTNAVRVAVLDQGPGVPEQYVDRIFEPFFRADSARSRDQGGYGLGLAIADRTVAVHKGTISAKNRPEGGLGLEVILPALPDSFAAEGIEPSSLRPILS